MKDIKNKIMSSNQSIQGKLAILLGISMLFCSVALIFTSLPTIEDNTQRLVENYLLDEAEAVGMLMDTVVRENGSDVLESYENLQWILGDIHVAGYETSYAYLTDGTGTMLYHPTQAKVGESVENTVVQGIVNGIAQGQTFTPEYIEYVFQGVDKLAAYYVGANNEFVLVITIDDDDANASLLSAFTSMLISAAVITFAATAIMMIILARIIKRITTVTNLVDEVSGGNLNLDTAPYEKLAKGKDETGVIARAALHLFDSLRESFTVITVDADELNKDSISMNDYVSTSVDTVHGISNAMNELAQGATAMAENVQNTASAMEEMNNNIEVIVVETEKSTTKLNETVEINNAARNELDKLTVANKETAEITEGVVAGIEESNKAVEQISVAIAMIMDIASQTNLLALNASIEAARAGDAGRGFAVVADQIKSLAEQSDHSAKDIQKVIQDITEKSRVNTEYAERIKAAVTAEQDVLHSVLEKFNAVGDNIADTSASFNTIDGLVEGLDVSKRVILDAIEQLSSISEENAASTQETNASTMELNEILTTIGTMAGNLREVAARLEEQAEKYQL